MSFQQNLFNKISFNKTLTKRRTRTPSLITISFEKTQFLIENQPFRSTFQHKAASRGRMLYILPFETDDQQLLKEGAWEIESYKK